MNALHLKRPLFDIGLFTKQAILNVYQARECAAWQVNFPAGAFMPKQKYAHHSKQDGKGFYGFGIIGKLWSLDVEYFAEGLANVDEASFL